ncbi:MAG: SDR family oxidoreductase [Muribaculaceae bacterium]|nr:SDR family oxidoreductase [Roseburia sp.]MCM1432279.1 SDR family oxidoreductase [Muribaculaceae bacterium]MCM1494055.1 SDR family oxidoreductase [Muribaculaceae bacterium]
MGRLDGKVAIITGGNSGIGAKAAEMFAKEGAKVVISARREAQLEEVAKNVREAGGEIMSVTCDISKSDQCAALVEKTVAKYGTVDILINNAGVLDSNIEAVEKVSDETIDYLIDINTKGTIYITRDCAKIMLEKKSGSIVNVSSVAGYCGNGGAAYVSSKAAVIGLTKNVAMRSASSSVRCNAVCPGTVVTPMTMGLEKDKLDVDMFSAMSKHADNSLPPCMPEEVANILLFLASDEASAVTGQVIVVDHGADL